MLLRETQEYLLSLLEQIWYDILVSWVKITS